jgi:hydrogenase expression/formation protein HypE
MRRNPYGRGACVVGEVKAEPQGIVATRTGFGGARIVDMLVGE